MFTFGSVPLNNNGAGILGSGNVSLIKPRIWLFYNWIEM